MPVALQSVLDLMQLGPHPLRHRDPLKFELPGRRLPADVREAEKVERLRLPESLRCTMLSGGSPKLDQARLLRMQLQRESSEALAEIPKEPLSLTPMLEPNHEIIDKSHDDHVAARMSLPPLLGPLVKDVMEVHIGEQR